MPKISKKIGFFDSYFWPFRKSEEKIVVIFVISAIMSSIWNVFIKFFWHDEKLTTLRVRLSKLLRQLLTTSFSNIFSLFQLLQLFNFYKQCWPYISFHSKHFLDLFLYIKTCNIQPFCYDIKSVLLRREHKYRVFHIEMFLLKWLWQIEICKLDFVWHKQKIKNWYS